MKRIMSFGLASLLFGCGQKKVTEGYEPIFPEEGVPVDVCTKALSYQKVLEERLGRWPSSVIGDISSIVFTAESVAGGELAAYDSRISEITLRADLVDSDPSSIDSIDHEIGHVVFNKLFNQRIDVSRPLLDEWNELKKQYSDKDELKEVLERRGLYEEFNNLKLYDQYNVQQFEDLLGGLKEYENAACTLAFVKTYYEDIPEMVNKMNGLFQSVELARGIVSYEDYMAEGDINFLQDYVNKYEQFAPKIRQSIKELEEINLNPDRACDTGLYKQLTELTNRQSAEVGRFLEGQVRIEEIYRTFQSSEAIDSIANFDTLGLGMLRLEMVLGSLSYETRGDVLENEMFARAVSSLMKPHFGLTEVGQFELNDELLDQFALLQYEAEPIFLDAVDSYKMARQSKAEGGVVNTLDVEPYVLDTLVCFKTEEDYDDYVMPKLESWAQKD